MECVPHEAAHFPHLPPKTVEITHKPYRNIFKVFSRVMTILNYTLTALQSVFACVILSFFGESRFVKYFLTLDATVLFFSCPKP